MYSQAAKAIHDRLRSLEQQGAAVSDQPTTNRAVARVQVQVFYQSSNFSRPDRPSNNHDFEQIETCQYLIELVFRDIRDLYGAQDLIQNAKEAIAGYQPLGHQPVPTQGRIFFGRSNFGKLTDEAGWLYNLTCSFDVLNQLSEAK